MKNDSFKIFRASFSPVAALAAGALLLSGGISGAIFLVPEAKASPELDRQYALTSIGILRAWDNVDGLFGDLVTKTYTEHLAPFSRFVVQDLAKANSALQSSKLPYAKVIEDPAILGQMAKTFRVDSFLRTKIYKEGPQYRFKVEWLHAAKLQVMASEAFQIEQPFRGEGKFGTEEFRSALTAALDRLIAQVPFKGSVSGRDQTAVTLNLGASSGIGKGDTVIIGTLDEVRFHPLLKTVVDWRLTPTGRVIVDEVDDGIAFAKIDTEEYGRQIQRFQKVVQIIPAPENVEIDSRVLDREALAKRAKEPPRIGWIAPGLLLGSSSRETGRDSGSGFLYGLKADAQTWFTSDFFGELRFAYGSAGYSQETTATGASSLADGDLSLSQFRLAMGYFYHVTPNFFGPKGWVKFGYQNTAYGLPENATAQTGKISYSGMFIGVGGDLPVRDDFGAVLDVDFGVFGGGTESAGFFGSSSGATAVNVFVGGYGWLQPKMKLQIGIDFKSHSLDFLNGTTVSNKTFAVSPSLLFYF